MSKNSQSEEKKQRHELGLKIMRIKGKRIKVLEVLENSPAEKAGMEKGMIVIKVNDKDVTKMPFGELVNNELRNPECHRISFEVISPDTDEKRNFTAVLK